MSRQQEDRPPKVPKEPITRRQWIRGTAAGLVLTATAVRSRGEEESSLRAQARQHLKLGIISGVYGELPLEQAARRIQTDGFRCVVTDFHFADVSFDPLEPDWDAARRIVSELERAGIEIAGLFGYYNVVDPDVNRRRRGEARMAALLSAGARLGCRLVSTGTGSFNRQSEWQDNPANQSEAAYLQCRAALQQHARTAEKHGSVLTIEPYYRNVIGTIDRAERLFEEVASPALRLVMDPCNYFRKDDLPRMRPVLEEMFRRLGDRIAISHAKDVKPSADGEELPAAGLGVLDYPLYLRLLARLGRPLPLIVEHLRGPDVSRAREFVLRQCDQI